MAKVKTINGEEQIQALVDKKKVIITETSVRSDLHLKDAKGTKCLPTATIFEQLTLTGEKTFLVRLHIFETMMVQPQEDMGEDLEIPTDSHHTPTVTKPSTSSQPQQKHKSKMSKKRITKVSQLSDSTHDIADEHMTTTSNDPLLSGEDRLKLTELIELCTQLHLRVLTLETTKANQALEIESLKRRVKKPEKKKDASKQGKMIEDLDADEGVALVDETQGRNDQDMFDTSIFDDDEVVAKKKVSTTDPVPTTGKVVNTAGVEVSTAGEVVTTADVKIMINEEVARNLEAQMQAELEEEERLARQKEEDNIALIESWDNTQAMMDAKYELAARLQEEEGRELTIEEKLRLFVELMDKRKKHFARLRDEKIRSKPPTKTKKRNQMCIYLKNMENYKHSQLKNKIFKEIYMLFNNTMKWIESFVLIDTELVKGSEKAAKGLRKQQKAVQ
nr:hypothetical protein [Tanacetum cinerariifolium]